MVPLLPCNYNNEALISICFSALHMPYKALFKTLTLAILAKKGCWTLVRTVRYTTALIAKADISSPRVESDQLMFPKSFSLHLSLADLSLPAKSTNHSLLYMHLPLVKLFALIIMQSMQRDRLWYSFPLFKDLKWRTFLSSTSPFSTIKPFISSTTLRHMSPLKPSKTATLFGLSK